VIEPKKKLVLTTETVPLPRQTVSGLIETLQMVFSDKAQGKPIRILYTKGEDLIVERTVSISAMPEDPFLTPYEMIRQHAEIEILETLGDPLMLCCKAAQRLGDEDKEITALVCRSKAEVSAWFPSGLQISQVFSVPLMEDSDCQEGCLFFCGSTISKMIRDIEYAVLCRME
tara:strand:- start:1374 stop:1889 length:516 start_codon:yes stop_codon:yes gene_type:complete